MNSIHRLFVLAIGASLLATAACQTKVVNEPQPAAKETTVIHDRPTVVQTSPPAEQPQVQNNIKVDR